MNSSHANKFCTIVTCMDGRGIKRTLDLLDACGLTEFEPDTVTNRGIVGRIAGRSEIHPAVLEDIETNIFKVSVKSHGSDTIVVTGHLDCAGNPGDTELQKEDVMATIAKIQEWEGNWDVSSITYIGVTWDENFQPVVFYNSNLAQAAA